MARNNTCKNAVSLEKKRSDISPPFGVPLCTLALQNAAFRFQTNSKGSWKKEMARKNA